jgi:hypothetical protein
VPVRPRGIKSGDRVVAQLHESGGGKRFKLLFLSSDQKTMIAFPRLNFRIVSDKVVVDFAAADWTRWSKYAKAWGGGSDGFPIKTSADRVWGEGNDCALGSLLTKEMFKPAPVAESLAQVAVSSAAVLTVESLVDGPSTLVVRRDGLFWENGDNAKLGLLREPTTSTMWRGRQNGMCQARNVASTARNSIP